MNTEEMRQEESVASVVPHPWRRYFARYIDIAAYTILWDVVASFVLRVNVLGDGWVEVPNYIIPLILMIVIEPALLSRFGTTLGKWIFGLSITKADGSKLSYSEGLERTWGVFGIGMGYGIPIYILYRYYKSYQTCTEDEMLEWDENISYTIKDTKGFRILLFIATYIVIIGISILVMFQGEMPKHRGGISTAEFVENYNDLMYYLDADQGKDLNEWGKWVDDPNDGTVYVPWRTSMPDFQIIETDGVVTEISFSVACENNTDWITSYMDQMIIAVFAYVGAQDGMNLINVHTNGMIETITNNDFQSFSFTEGGIQVNCEVEYSGYQSPSSGMLIPQSDTNTFSLSFSMKKVE